jgi:pyruvate dehydrogenase E2 component (dihydrolipoamide acetyltransferase)/2-oxoglutarate dehydrogenase E2 component (dihydrolipoamide succinyltransferase)
MPVLGMSQDTGVIANWCKSHGDYVEAGELLMEVETDKAVQEIEAAESGYLNIIGHAEGMAIPVGEVVATLNEEPVDKNAIVISAPVAEPTAIAVVHAPAPLESVLIADNPALASATTLASAKARATAYRNDLALKDISEAQGKYVLHVIDVENYLATRKQTAVASYATGTAIEQPSRLDVKIKVAGLEYCQEWLLKHHDLDHRLLASHIVATLTLGLWRDRFAQDRDTNLTIRVDFSDSKGMQSELLLNPDRQRFSQLKAEDSERHSDPDIRLVDLMSTRLSAYEPGSVTEPVLVLCKEDEQIKISLYGVDSAQLSNAIGFIDSLADQLEEPLVHIA